MPSVPALHNSDVLTSLEMRDGTVVRGYSFGAQVPAAGELVFQTGMVGYPEALTDPSYEGQILVLTFPMIGNYGVPDRDEACPLVPALPRYFESRKIHVAGLVVASYTEEYSHHLAKSSLGEWLREQGIPAVYGVDTRAITKRIRNEGSVLARLWPEGSAQPDWYDPNAENLVARVSTLTEPVTYTVPSEVTALRRSRDGRALRVLVVDVGLKFNQVRCLVKRGAEVTVVPWDYAFDTMVGDYDGLFVSNGPGDPAKLGTVVERLARVMESKSVPVFGICLGHQLIARAAGADTTKLKFGNRGHNIPATNLVSGRCHITSQNHGYAVDAATLPDGWRELFVNANDGSNEGVWHTELPFFSVQFHPESAAGPQDTEFLFDVFLKSCTEFERTGGELKPVTFPHAPKPARVHAKKVLVLGSGGLSIGQAGEFDYSGSQAIKALKEEGIYTVLINPNIATVQTSKGLADKVYFLPVNPDFVRKVIKHERPDAIYVTFGGQTALSVGIALHDELEGLGVKVLGTPIQTVVTTEDRELFSAAMSEIGEKCATSFAAQNWDEAKKAAEDIGYPVIVRAAYALGGLGSGFADNEEQLRDLCNKAFAASPQVLVERSMKGWKEIEYEVVRDAADNCITVCNMENFDPLGIHTGDSIVVAPSQTLSDSDYNMLRTTAINVIRHLGVVGECNIQYALNPHSKEYCIIEVNARLSRSSALASKATGYPLAFVAAKLGLGITLPEITNAVTQSTCACFEPSLDYCVVKIPRWDLKKFLRVSKKLSSSMKSVGEVMAIGRTFEEAIQKAIRATDYQNMGFSPADALMSIDIAQELQTPSDQRLFALANAFDQGYTVERAHELTSIDPWFLNKLKALVDYQRELASSAAASGVLSAAELRKAKQLGFDDRQIARVTRSNALSIRDQRIKAGVVPVVKRVDTVAAEFPAVTNYLYLTYNGEQNDVTFEDHGTMVLGSGVYRIGSSVEFDWCAVQAVRTLRQAGRRTIMVNYNPETVSTDYDEVDRLYFEDLSLERVLDIYELEQSSGVVVSMGGQTSNNIALALQRQNVHVMGTAPDMIDRAENRYKFSRMLDAIGVDQPAWKELTSISEAHSFAERVGYPVLVRPSYVLSGAAMNTVYTNADLEQYLRQAAAVSPEYPVVITKYIENAKEIEMDAVAQEGQMIAHVVSEHVENAGVHSGDATLVCPPQDLAPETVQRIVDATAAIGDALNVTGPYNIQFIAKDNQIKVIECNVRASRSFPFVSKATGVNMIELATRLIAGLPVGKIPDPSNTDRVAVKVPQFSFSRLSGADPVLGVEMASTGEVAAFGHTKYDAYLKALVASSISLPNNNILLSIGSYKEKAELLPSVRKLAALGYSIYATAGTTDFLVENGVQAQLLEFLPDAPTTEEDEYSLTQYLATNRIDMYVNLPSANRFRRPASYMSRGYRTRRMAVDYAVPLVTNVKCAKLLFEALARKPSLEISRVDAQLSHQVVNVAGGFVDIGTTLGNRDHASHVLNEALAHGFTQLVLFPALESALVASESGLDATRRLLSESPVSSDWLPTVAATASNAATCQTLEPNVGALWMPFGTAHLDNVGQVTQHFEVWPASRLVVTDATATNLASVLLLASLYGRRVHVNSVRSRADLQLVRMTRAKGMNVTMDVSVLALTLTAQAHPLAAEWLPATADDQAALWEYFDDVDALSVGPAARHVPSGYAMALSHLADAVHSGRLNAEDVVTKLSTVPRRIFGLPIPGTSTSLEVDLDRPVQGLTSHGGCVERVEVTGKLVAQEGQILNAVHGHNLAAEVVTGVDIDVDSSVVSSATHKDQTLSQSQSQVQAQTPGTILGSPAPVAKRRMASMSSQRPNDIEKDRALLKDLLRANPFLRRHVTSVHQFSRRNLHELFNLAQDMRLAVERRGGLDLLNGRVLATMFYEPSTRTHASFDAAMQRLGGRVIPVSVSNSSVQKGETLQDTLRTLGSYCDAVVLRHPDPESIRVATKYLSVPAINGGNGAEEHPTQAFLDLFTIREELGSVNNLTITFMGDLRYGRTVHSLVQLLSHYHVNVQLVSPTALELPTEFRDQLKREGKLRVESAELTDAILAETDVLYCTRVQKERFASLDEYERLKNVYRVDNAVMAKCKTHMCVMHPLPRTGEIAEEVDFDHRAAYFRQMRYGLYVRMALLLMVIGVDF